MQKFRKHRKNKHNKTAKKKSIKLVDTTAQGQKQASKEKNTKHKIKTKT